MRGRGAAAGGAGAACEERASKVLRRDHELRRGLTGSWVRRFDRDMSTRLLAGTLVVAAASAAQAICTANMSPPVACTIKVPANVKIRITRDDYGVPHVKARSLYDIGYGMGQAQAQDRLFQMELVRKSATGNVAELFGTSFLSSDIDARRQFYSDDELQALAKNVSCPVQTIV